MHESLWFRFRYIAAESGVRDTKRMAATETIKFKGSENHVVKIGAGGFAAGGACERDRADGQSVIRIRIGVSCGYFL
jgi:hypothetical protein